MDINSLFSPEIYSWVILPLLIFLARVLDVTLGTLRIVFLSKGRRTLAPLLGFFEVLIWIVAIGQIVQNLTSIPAYFAYAAGFAAGNYIGLAIENRLAIGTLAVRVITAKLSDPLISDLREAGFGVTHINAEGATGPVHIIYTIIKRKDLPEVAERIFRLNPKAFFSVEEIRGAREGIFPHYPPIRRRRLIRFLGLKGKR